MIHINATLENKFIIAGCKQDALAGCKLMSAYRRCTVSNSGFVFRGHNIGHVYSRADIRDRSDKTGTDDKLNSLNYIDNVQ